jgi:peroxiredoxin
MKAYHTAFVVDSVTLVKYRLWGINIETSNGNKDHILPVPATYVIGKDGLIKYGYFNFDYKKRATVKDILNALE